MLSTRRPARVTVSSGNGRQLVRHRADVGDVCARRTQQRHRPNVLAATTRPEVRCYIEAALRERAALTFFPHLDDLASAVRYGSLGAAVIYLDGNHDGRSPKVWLADLSRLHQAADNVPIIALIPESAASFRQYLAARAALGHLVIHPRESLASAYDRAMGSHLCRGAVDDILQHCAAQCGDIPPRAYLVLRACLEHARERLSVTRLAECLDARPRTLAHRLDAARLHTPEALIMWGRVFTLAWMLRDPGMTISRAARELGYRDSHEVHDLVRAYLGCPVQALRAPTALRETAAAWARARPCRNAPAVARPANDLLAG